MSDFMSEPPVPEGYAPLFRSSPFLDHVGPLYFRHGPSGFTVGMQVLPHHTNSSGTMHGGLIATLADVSLGYVTAESRQPPLKMVTASLAVDFIGIAKPGEWVESHVSIAKVGKRMAFATADITTGSGRVAQARAVFLVIAESE